MYTKFFNLSCKPFDVSPNPRFFYLNTPLKKIVADINKNFFEPMSVIVLTGGIGTGKTTVLNYLNQQFRLIYPCQPMVSKIEVFMAVNAALEIRLDSMEPAVLCNTTAKYLKDLPEKKQYDALFVDEAQGCSTEALSGIRQLQEAVHKNGGNLPVLLSGHKELVSKISKLTFEPEMGHHLFFYEMENFNFQDMQSMIDYRLKLAGSSLLSIFSETAIEAVYKMTNGVPRLVNDICDISLMTSFGKDENIISAETVLDVAENTMNLQRQFHLSPATEPLVETIESKKIMPLSQRPDIKISENNTPDKGPGKNTFPSRAFKIAASVLLVSMLVGLSGLFLHKRTRVENDTDLFHPTQETVENPTAKEDAPMGLGYSPASDLSPQTDHQDGEQTSRSFVLNNGKAAVPEGYFKISDGLLDEPGKGDMSFEMVLSDRQGSSPLEETDAIPIRPLENNTVKEEITPEIALNNQYAQKQTVQDRTALAPTLPEKIIHGQAIPEPTAPDEIIPYQITKDQIIRDQLAQIMVAPGQIKSEKEIPEETLPEEELEDQSVQIKIVPEQAESEEKMPEGTTPEQELEDLIVQIMVAQEQTIPEPTEPDEIIPGQTAQDQIAQIKVVPEQAKSKKAIPEGTLPEQELEDQMVQVTDSHEQKKTLSSAEVASAVRVLPEVPAVENTPVTKPETARSSKGSMPDIKMVDLKKPAQKTPDSGSKTIQPETFKAHPKPQFNAVLSMAIQNNDNALVTQLLAQGADPGSTDENGSPLLLKAAESGNQEIFNALLNKGADINARDRYGDTPLMKAAWAGSSHVVSLLLTHHADINRQNPDGFSALFYGAINGHAQIVKTLLDHQADTELADINKKTPLMAAAWNGNITIVNLLLEHNASVDKTDKSNWTALMFAAFQGHEDTFKRLIAAGSNTSLKNSEGDTCVTLAASQGYNELVLSLAN